MRCGVSVSMTAQTGQSEAIHSPEACANTVVRLIIPAVCPTPWSGRWQSHAGPKSCARCRVRSTARRSETSFRPALRQLADRGDKRFFRIGEFICALARAAARLPIEPLDRCMFDLPSQEVKTDGAGLRTLGPNAMADRLMGILRHQALQLRLGLSCSRCAAFVREKTAANSAQAWTNSYRQSGQPRSVVLVVRCQTGQVARQFSTQRQNSVRRDDKVLVERIGMVGDFDHLCRR